MCQIAVCHGRRGFRQQQVSCSLQLLLLLAISALLMAPCTLARMMDVGRGSGVEVENPQPFTVGVNMTAWALDNPLYVGDIAVLKYRYHMQVYAVPDKAAWLACDFKAPGAALLGAPDLSEDRGLWIEVLPTPQYIITSVPFCQNGVKVVLEGKLGPCPEQLCPEAYRENGLNAVNWPPPASLLYLKRKSSGSWLVILAVGVGTVVGSFLAASIFICVMRRRDANQRALEQKSVSLARFSDGSSEEEALIV